MFLYSGNSRKVYKASQHTKRMNTYYSLEEELALLEEIATMLNEKLSTFLTNASRLDSYGLLNELSYRFHEPATLMQLPANLLQMAEARAQARQNGWNIEEAKDDTHYRTFIEPTQQIIQKSNAQQLGVFDAIQKYLEPDQHCDKNRLQPAQPVYAIAEQFIPLYRCTRDSSEAYISAYNKAYALPSRSVGVSKGEEVILDRGNGNHLSLTPSLFYMPTMNLGVEEREKLKDFWR